MGLLIAFGDDANFVLTVGGFHPRFNPPPLPFPSPAPDRAQHPQQASAPHPRRGLLRGHHATPCSSARAVELFFGFERLQRRGPPRLRRAVPVLAVLLHRRRSRRRSRSRCSASACSASGSRLTLEGPTPWHVEGSGSISLLFFDIDVDFDVTWGERSATPSCRRSRSCRCCVERARQAARAGRRCLPAGRQPARLAARARARPRRLVLHPVGALRISQRAVPLDLTIDKVGNQQPVRRRRKLTSRRGRRAGQARRRRRALRAGPVPGHRRRGEAVQPAFERSTAASSCRSPATTRARATRSSASSATS